MENTCRGINCWFYLLIQDLKGDSTPLDFEDCPFFVKSMWMPPPVAGVESSVPKEVKDCSNKRSLITLMFDILPRLQGVQAASEEFRNSSMEASDILSNVIQAAMEKRKRLE